jgi:hypothetical protein
MRPFSSCSAGRRMARREDKQRLRFPDDYRALHATLLQDFCGELLFQ